MRYLATRENGIAHSSAELKIAERITAANPLMEVLGNAKWVPEISSLLLHSCDAHTHAHTHTHTFNL